MLEMLHSKKGLGYIISESFGVGCCVRLVKHRVINSRCVWTDRLDRLYFKSDQHKASKLQYCSTH